MRRRFIKIALLAVTLLVVGNVSAQTPSECCMNCQGRISVGTGTFLGLYCGDVEEGGSGWYDCRVNCTPPDEDGNFDCECIGGVYYCEVEDRWPDDEPGPPQ